MRMEFLARLGAAAAAVSMLGACGFLPPTETEEFTVTGAVAQQAGTFRNTDPNINDLNAKLVCADGYEKVDQATLPADPGSLEVWRVHCAPYSVSFLPEF
ncbi:MAG TPA: hypothetical protein VM689_12305 [Aliidongia sp.]|nr:hypothetical protein [Aliidongia sp.]